MPDDLHPSGIFAAHRDPILQDTLQGYGVKAQIVRAATSGDVFGHIDRACTQGVGQFNDRASFGVVSTCRRKAYNHAVILADQDADCIDRSLEEPRNCRKVL